MCAACVHTTRQSYEGEWLNKLAHGHGKLVRLNPPSTYTGSFLNGVCACVCVCVCVRKNDAGQST